MKTPVALLSGRLLARNVGWNLAGAGVPLLLALWAIPRLVEGMGTERFGLFGVISASIGYFSLFDLGVGAALAKLASERLGKGEVAELPHLLQTALWILLGLGFLAAFLVAPAVPWLISELLLVPTELVGEAEKSLWIVAATLPFVTLTSGLNGILRAYQRFDQINLVRIPLGAANFILPVLALEATPSLVATTALLAASRVLTWVTYRQLCRPFLSIGCSRGMFSWESVRDLVGFGGWLTVSNVIGPLMVYFDRFLIGAIVGMAAVAYYTTPYEVITRLWIIPDALFGVVFPALAMALAANDGRAKGMFNTATRGLALSAGISIAFVMLFARDGLDFWLGPVFAAESTGVLRWLGIGVFINCFARLPFTALQAAGRPDLTAKLHLAELPVYLGLLWLLTDAFGIMGTAVAWTARIAVDAVALFALGRQVVPELRGEQQRAFATVAIGVLGLCAVVVLDVWGFKLACSIALSLLALVFVAKEWRAIRALGFPRLLRAHS